MVLDAYWRTSSREHVVCAYNLKHKKKPSSVNATQQVARFVRNLEKGCYLAKIMSKAKDKLCENMFCGESIQKGQIPKYYVKTYGLNNLCVMELDSSKRLTYTLLSNGIGVGVYIIEVFLNHRDYDRRFGYT
jgi:hypothetical protein